MIQEHIKDKKIIETYSCIFAVAWRYDDGSMSCGLKGSDRDCHWCEKYLEQKQIIKEDNLKYGDTAGRGWNPRWPNELSSIFPYYYPDGSFAWWDVGVEMYRSLKEAIQHGWELDFDWQKEEKEPMGFGCTKTTCRANSYYGRDSLDCRHACCSIELTSPALLDVEANNCGFIRVNDRWTMWKWGVDFKDFKCGNCQFYKGEMHGYCSNANKPQHGDGRFSGAHACEKFVKNEIVYIENNILKNLKRINDCINGIDELSAKLKAL